MNNMRGPAKRKHHRSDVEERIRMLRQRIDLERSIYNSCRLDEVTQGNADSGNFLPDDRELVPRHQNERKFPGLRGETSHASQWHRSPVDTSMHLLRFQQQADELEERIRHSEQYRTDLANELRLRFHSLSERKEWGSSLSQDEHKSRAIEDKKVSPRRTGSTSKRFDSSERPASKSSLKWDSPSTTPPPHDLTDGPLRCVPVTTEEDAKGLSEYQRLIRLCMEFFECNDDPERASSRGRDVAPRQVGLRCRFCRDQPDRVKGGVYFPKEVASVYQAAQNMARNHLLGGCALVPQKIRKQMQEEQAKTKRRSGGKQFWVNATIELGLYDREGRLFFKPNASV